MHQRNQDAIYKREMPNDEAVPGLTEILWQDKQDGWEVGAQNFLTQLQPPRPPTTPTTNTNTNRNNYNNNNIDTNKVFFVTWTKFIVSEPGGSLLWDRGEAILRKALSEDLGGTKVRAIMFMIDFCNAFDYDHGRHH